MTLLTAAIAAVIVTLVWYFKDGTNEMRIGTLSLMYWGATLMWLVDAVVEYIELKAAYFTPEPVRNYTDAKKADTARFREYFHFMLDQGNYFGPSQFEAIFVSNAHTLREIDKTLGDADAFFSAHSGN